MSARRTLIAANWKMHKTLEEARTLTREVRRGLTWGLKAEVALAPPFTALNAVAEEIAGSDIRLSGQDCYWERQGAFTGAVSPVMLKDVGCHYVIIGHSERRQYFGETDESANRRVQAVVRNEMHPILCVGETLQEREAGRTLDVVGRQVKGGLAGFGAAEVSRFVLAYEPVGAIGTGKTATSAQAQEVHAFIREQLVLLFGRACADQVRIQYGGSVKPENAAELMAQPDVDGALVGGASLKAHDFAAIVKASAGEGGAGH